MTRLCLVICAFFILTVSSASAQPAVTLRLGEHDGYTRVVFDWNRPVPYDVQQTAPDELLASFHAAADIWMDAKPKEGSGITEVKQISSDGTNLQVVFKIVSGYNFRHFKSGDRVVLDVINPSAPAKVAAAPAPEKEEPAPEPAKSPEPPEKKPVKIAHSSSTDDIPEMPAVKAGAVEVEKVDGHETDEKVEEQKPVKFDYSYLQEDKKSIIEQNAPQFEPHVITISATESVGIAAFRRNDWLWIVLDKPSMTVPPIVAGEQSDEFGKFQRFELNGGLAYRVKLPPGALGLYNYAEGGGLVWRIILTPNERDVKPVEMTRSFNTTKMVRGGTSTWPFLMTTKVLEVPDPSVGDVLDVVTVERSDQMAGPARDLVDFDVLNSIVGMAIKPEVDDLEVKLTSSGAEVTRTAGLAISRMKDVSRRRIREEVQGVSVAGESTPEQSDDAFRLIFDFDRWMMGGIQALEDNQRILMAGMAVKDTTGRVQDLLTLAKMNVSNDRGQEALGFLAYAASELPDLADSPEFRALRGAAAALAGKYEEAFRDLFHPTLMDYDELDYWRAYTLAWLEDWQQAVETMPDDFNVLIGYPLPLLEKIGVKLAEVALRAGEVETAEGILAVLQQDRTVLKPWTMAGIDYLKGEAHRQSSEYELARQRWDPLITGRDDFYRARAGLALTTLELENGDITPEAALDRLEGLRYAWRGDELEAWINFLAGKMYIENDRYLKGFSILREATTMSVDSDISKEITSYMQSAFKDLLLNDQDLTPLEAVEVYEEFRELTPSGDDGNRLVQKLAERLVEADLLGRATEILKHQVEFRLDGEDKARNAVRLGTIYLLDKNAREAMKYLSLGRDMYAKLLEGNAREQKLKDIDLLRARGLSQLNRTEEAIALLNTFEPSPEVNKLRTDIAWQAGLWEDAAEALQDLILDEALDLERPLTNYQADLVLNRAVALNLSGNRVALNNMRRRYEDSMKRTPRARLFDVVTRPRKTAILADRETIESIVSEVDMFEDFLQTYKTDAEAVSN